MDNWSERSNRRRTEQWYRECEEDLGLEGGDLRCCLSCDVKNDREQELTVECVEPACADVAECEKHGQGIIDKEEVVQWTTAQQTRLDQQDLRDRERPKRTTKYNLETDRDGVATR